MIKRYLIIIILTILHTLPVVAADLDKLNRFTVSILDKDLEDHGAGVIYGIKEINYKYSRVKIVTVEHVLYSRNMVRFFDGTIYELKKVKTSNKKDLAILECLVPSKYTKELVVCQFSVYNIAILDEVVAQGTYNYVDRLVLRFTVCFLPVSGGERRSQLVHFGIQGCAFHGLSGAPVVNTNTNVVGLIQGAWKIISWSDHTMPPISLVIPAKDIEEFIRK